MAKLVEQVYSEALFSLARDENMIEQVESDFSLFSELLENNPDFYEFFRSPIVSKEEKKNLLTKAIKDQVSGTFYRFLMILIEKNRGHRILEMQRLYEKRCDEELDRSEAVVESAKTLDDQELEKIKKKLELISNKSIRIKTKVKKELIGGLRIYLDGRIIDNSLDKDLRAIKSIIETAIV